MRLCGFKHCSAALNECIISKIISIFGYLQGKTELKKEDSATKAFDGFKVFIHTGSAQTHMLSGHE